MTNKDAKVRKPMTNKAFAAELRRLTAELRSLEKEVAAQEAEQPIEVVVREHVLAADLLKHILKAIDDGHAGPGLVEATPHIVKAIDDAETRYYELANPGPGDLRSLITKALYSELPASAYREDLLGRLLGPIERIAPKKPDIN
jgi:hypothetical protein